MRDSPNAIEVSLERAYRKKDIPRFVKLVNKMMTLSSSSTSGEGAILFKLALTAIQKKKDDLYNSVMNKGDERYE